MTILSRTLGAAAAVCLLASPAWAAKAGKTDVCHPAGQSGQVLTLNVNANSLSGHLGHGDWLPLTFFADADGDGYGDADVLVEACVQPADASTVAGDCDDSDSAVNPDAAEVCDDGIDNDCNDLVDAADPACVSCPCFDAQEILDAWGGAPFAECYQDYDVHWWGEGAWVEWGVALGPYGGNFNAYYWAYEYGLEADTYCEVFVRSSTSFYELTTPEEHAACIGEVLEASATMNAVDNGCGL